VSGGRGTVAGPVVQEQVLCLGGGNGHREYAADLRYI
jgi:hypothetical protein